MIDRFMRGAALAALGLTVSALVAGQALAATPKDTIVMAKTMDDITSLDPAEVFEFTGGEVINNVYVRLMTYDPSDFTKLIGGAAESWSVSDDGKTFTIKIRQGMKFTTGRPVTAKDAAFSLQRVVALGKSPAFILVQFGWSADNVKEMVTAPDDQTLVLKTATAFAPSFVMNCLSAGVGSVVDAEEALKNAKDNDFGYNWLRTNSAGSGAYKLISWKPKESVVLEANPGFYRGEAKTKRIIIRHVPEPTAQRLMLEKGDADIARNLTADQLKAIAADTKLAVNSTGKGTIYYLALNQKNPALSKPKVREAVRWLIDYQTMSSTFLAGQYGVHQGFWGKGSAGSLDDTPFKFDPAKAKALLAEAGYPNGLELDLDAGNTSPHADIAQSVQSTFAQAGVKVNIVPGDIRQVLTKYRARNHQLLLMYWSPDYLDPHSTADFFTNNPDNSDGAKAKTGAWRNAWDIPDLTKETAAAVLERDPQKRIGMYIDLQKKVQADGPIVVMFQQTEQAALRAEVKNFILGPSFDTPVYWQITK
ncbi:MAG: ABC transporter substrate-binding protein [Ferrovibrionaceae bacterium]